MALTAYQRRTARKHASRRGHRLGKYQPTSVLDRALRAECSMCGHIIMVRADAPTEGGAIRWACTKA
jgi:hypothetical protein